MAIYGYARASTLDQDVAIQEEALRRAGRVDRLARSIKDLQDIVAKLRRKGRGHRRTRRHGPTSRRVC
ncbi:hypothetical protein [Azospirillum himalayense]|uniref:Resolvase/invertase-type recombinase catalytic domain-containing protein n=1 Tax=Azospirillum himalayense TaxID=654847 RepID=A0ABW0G360_9PROT